MLRSVGHLLRRSRPPCMTAVRSFAEAPGAAEGASVKPPSVPMHGTEGRYALALYMAGQKAGKLADVGQDLVEVRTDWCYPSRQVTQAHSAEQRRERA